MKQKIAIIGTGLIGGSLGLALKQAKLDVEIVGHDKNSSAAGLAKKRGAVDKTDWNLLSTVEGAALIIIATPVMAVKETLQIIAPELKPGTLVTDTASTKQQVMSWANELLPKGVDFVGGHPLATQVGSGMEAATPNLFTDRAYCLMPAANARESALETMAGLAQMIGARPFFIDPLEHDAYAAAVDHLPFLAATALMHTVVSSPGWREIRRLAASEFENASLPVSGNAYMYSGICETNKDALLRWLDDYIMRMTELRDLVAEGSNDLLAVFSKAQEERAAWLASVGKEDVADLPSSGMAGTSDQLKQIFLGGLADRPLPGEKRK